jgi:hypothetical protein
LVGGSVDWAKWGSSGLSAASMQLSVQLTETSETNHLQARNIGSNPSCFQKFRLKSIAMTSARFVDGVTFKNDI